MTIVPSRGNVPTRLRRNRTRSCAPRAAAQRRRTQGSPPCQHDPVVRASGARTAQLGLAVRVEVGVAVEVVVGEIQEDADRRPEALRPTRAGSSTPRRPHSRRQPRPPRSSGVPRLPPTNGCRPADAACAPRSVVVVLFPFVPVTAWSGTASERSASSISREHRRCRDRSPRSAAGDLGGTPGLGITRSTPSSSCDVLAAEAPSTATPAMLRPSSSNPRRRTVGEPHRRALARQVARDRGAGAAGADDQSLLCAANASIITGASG